jgi:hypothetical protein
LPNDDKIHEIVATSFAHDKYTQHFLREDFAKLMAELESAQSQNLHHHLKSSDTDLLVSLLRTLTERGRLPCLIYHHDRKKCENYAFASRVLDLIDGFSFIFTFGQVSRYKL